MAKEYVKNSELLAAVVESKNAGKLTPETIAMFTLMISGIAKKMSYKDPEDREDCMAFAMEDLCKYWNRFNPEKSNNPFAYFTQIIHYAFLRRIQREKRQLEIKNKILERSGFSEVFSDDNSVDGGNYSDYNSIKDGVHSKLRY